MTGARKGRFPGVTRRCGCTDPASGKKYGARCPRLADPRHGSWQWRADLGPGWDPDAGRWKARRQPSGTAASALAAREARDRAIRRFRDARPPEPAAPVTTVRMAFADAMRARQTKGLARSTLAEYQRHLDHHILPQLGDLDIRALTAAHLEARYAQISEENAARVAAGRRPVGHATIHAVHRTVRSLLSVLARRPEYGLNGRNVARDVELVAPRRAPLRTWDGAQLGAFLAHAEKVDDPLLAAWYVIISLGLRRGEVCGMRWRYLDLTPDAGTLTIPNEPGATRIVVRGRVVESQPKTDGSAATLALDPHTTEQLRRHRRRQERWRKEWRLAVGPDGPPWPNENADLVFVHPDGTPWHPDAVSRRFRVLAAGAGLPMIPPKNLRHSSATHGLRSGTETLHDVMQRLRHSSPSVTTRFYADAMPERQRAAAEARVADILRSAARTDAG